MIPGGGELPNVLRGVQMDDTEPTATGASQDPLNGSDVLARVVD